MRTNILIPIAVALALLSIALYILLVVPSREDTYGIEPGGVYCTADAMMCPDGSYVGRTGPNCEFVCPNSAPFASTSGSASSGSTITKGEVAGRVLISPVCPVEQLPTTTACAPRAFKTVVEVRETGRVSLLASTETDSGGTFRFLLSPGSYDFLAIGKTPYPRCVARTVIVGSVPTSSLDLVCDSGIR